MKVMLCIYLFKQYMSNEFKIRFIQILRKHLEVNKCVEIHMECGAYRKSFKVNILLFILGFI